MFVFIWHYQGPWKVFFHCECKLFFILPYHDMLGYSEKVQKTGIMEAKHVKFAIQLIDELDEMNKQLI